MATNMDKALNELFDVITHRLKQGVGTAVDEEKARIYKECGLDKYLQELKALRLKKDEVDEEIDTLKKKIKKAEGGYQDEVPEVLQRLGCCSQLSTAVTVKAYERVKDRTEAKNLLAFQEIEENIRDMYRLTITSKEKRDIVLSLQHRNWRDLGINLPPINALDGLEIKDGEIKISATDELPALSES